MVRTIAIVGAGFSGSVTALNLLKANRGDIRVVLIDSVHPNAKGLAYSTFDDNCVLNVPAQNMSAFPDKPDDFANYCSARDSALVTSSFVPRRIYGEYLKQHLDIAKQTYQDDLVLLEDEVLSLHKLDGAYRLSCVSGGSLDAHTVILAFGHFAPKPLNEVFAGKIDPRVRVVDNPWSIEAVDSVPRDKDVLIVGSGHTAIDTLFRLETAGTDRRFYLFSRHGLPPNGHRPFGEFRKDPNLQDTVENALLQTISRNKSIRQVVRVVRHLIDHLEVDWRDIINALRPVTPKLWQGLPPQERARFLRHVVPHWDVVRHRLAPLAAKRLASGIVQGRTRIGAYSIQKVEALQDGLAHVIAKRRGTDAVDSFKVAAVINCMGPHYDIRRTGNALVSFLAQNGILRQDEARIGFQLAPDYTVNPGYPNLHYIGPMLKATFWEAIAVPELRVHSANLAQKVLTAFD